MAIRTTNRWKLGLFIVVTLAMGIASLFWLAQGRFRRDTFSAVAYFDESVQGLEVGSPMKFRGVPTGVVSDITIAPDRRHVQVTSEVYWDVMLRLGILSEKPTPRSSTPFIEADLRVQLATTGITGVKYLDVDVFDPARTPLPELPFPTPWSYIPSVPSTPGEPRRRADAGGEPAASIEGPGGGAMVEGKDSRRRFAGSRPGSATTTASSASSLVGLHGAAGPRAHGARRGAHRRDHREASATRRMPKPAVSWMRGWARRRRPTAMLVVRRRGREWRGRPARRAPCRPGGIPRGAGIGASTGRFARPRSGHLAQGSADR
jgi:hypothetical protein